MHGGVRDRRDRRSDQGAHDDVGAERGEEQQRGRQCRQGQGVGQPVVQHVDGRRGDREPAEREQHREPARRQQAGPGSGARRRPGDRDPHLAPRRRHPGAAAEPAQQPPGEGARGQSQGAEQNGHRDDGEQRWA